MRVQTIHTARDRCLSHARSTRQPHLPSSNLPSQTLSADLHPSMSAQAQIDRIVSLSRLDVIVIMSDKVYECVVAMEGA